jgi:hypothetical protein
MPRLSARSFAEMLNLPVYEQQRILHEQKYPRQQPQAFKIPYYQPALRGIRSYYQSGNNQAELVAARRSARAINLYSRAQNNLRVINAFGRSPQRQRQLVVETQPNVLILAAPDVELKLHFDVCANENNDPRRIFYNCRNVPIDPEIARLTLEVSHWILDKNGMPVPYDALEYVDLTSRRVHHIGRMRVKTSKLIAANAKIISTLWPTI